MHSAMHAHGRTLSVHCGSLSDQHQSPSPRTGSRQGRIASPRAHAQQTGTPRRHRWKPHGTLHEKNATIWCHVQCSGLVMLNSTLLTPRLRRAEQRNYNNGEQPWFAHLVFPCPPNYQASTGGSLDILPLDQGLSPGHVLPLCVMVPWSAKATRHSSQCHLSLLQCYLVKTACMQLPSSARVCHVHQLSCGCHAHTQGVLWLRGTRLHAMRAPAQAATTRHCWMLCLHVGSRLVTCPSMCQATR